MHIEPGIVEGSKILLSYATAAASLGFAVKAAAVAVGRDGAVPFLLRTALAAVLVFCFFEVFPHRPVGVSEVHLILGTTLLLLFGVAPAAIGLAAGLLVQGVLFAPLDLPQYGINVTTLLVPLFATAALAKKVVPADTPYVDIRYGQALRLSLAYQGGIVLWVAFWAFYGQGLGTTNLSRVAAFGASYLTVVLVEPLLDLAVLAGAKALRGLRDSAVVHRRLYAAEAA